MVHQWQLQEAKVHFSRVVERALAGEVQVVTRRGRRAVVVNHARNMSACKAT